jgi:hypothetical protein
MGGAANELNRLAISATNHCVTGSVIGDIVGMAIAAALGWAKVAQIALAVGLANLFGFSLATRPLGFAIAYPFAFWANRYMIARGSGLSGDRA